ncbi:hypothetical protein MAM1_0044d03068 [Mucor ambiguus]|uniref:HMG box domain-containing protein n=1 Tax=Mucor ambiguus TaxID=91626 RepID=A0A0C9MNM1_9FUNG|nr:hypothetical protein MAM1_0044d03068 [Mucor ambiguus]
MLVNHHCLLQQQPQQQSPYLSPRQHTVRAVEDEDEEDDELKELDMIGSHNYNSKKAPNSFLLFSAKRRNDLRSDGKQITTHQLAEEWKNMTNEQKSEFQNQSQCIQFTLDIDNRAPTTANSRRKHPFIPKIVVPPASSMVIPNDHSADSSPVSSRGKEDEDEEDSYFMQDTSTYHLYHQPYQQQQQNQHHNHHQHRQHQQPSHHHMSSILMNSFQHDSASSHHSHSPHSVYTNNQHHQAQRYFHHHASPPPPQPPQHPTTHIGNHYQHYQQQQQQQQQPQLHHRSSYHYHHLINDTSPIASPPTPYHFHQQRQLYPSNNSSSCSSSSQSNTNTPPHTGYTSAATSAKLIPNLSYSAAAEAAALESLSFNEDKEPLQQQVRTQTQPQQQQKTQEKAGKTTPTKPPSSTTAASTTSQSTKRKYGIIPEKVKRPPNAYLLFNRDMRRQLHDVNQGLSSGEISKSISQRWKQLSSIEKDFYFKEEQKLKEQHKLGHDNFIYTRRSKAEMKQAGHMKKQQQQQQQINHQTKPISPPLPQPPPSPQVSTATSSTATTRKKQANSNKRKPANIVGRDPRGRKKKKPDDTLPKHPMSAYLHFAKEMRPIMKKRFPTARLVEISKEIGNEWRAMAQIDLQKWMDMANLDKARYAKEMKERIIHGQQQQESVIVNDDVQSLNSGRSSISSSSGVSSYENNSPLSTKKRKFSSISSNSTLNSTNNASVTAASVLDDLDSDIIATVAQMVNPNAALANSK